MDAYHTEIVYLSNLLEKLLKVIRHSDPTADQRKKVLYRKYKTLMERLSLKLRNSKSWEEIRYYLMQLQSDPNIGSDEETRKIVIEKLLKDLEEKFYVRPKLTEFAPPSSSKINPKPKSIHRPTPPRQSSPEEEEEDDLDTLEPQKSFTKEDLMEMAVSAQQKQQARQDLGRLVEAIRNKIDPEKLEKKIELYQKTRNLKNNKN